ncbi:MAG: T9SS type A sorting domain-containing protein [Bacteroidia bacterium]|nr:T9SS type A sorting domain-containing protein [Bacteroidia bacterium]
MKSKKIIILLLSHLAFAQTVLPPKPAYPFNIKQIHVGHSLTDPLFSPWPGMYNGAVAAANSVQPWQSWGTFVGKATIPGSWIRHHWDTSLTWCGQTASVACYETNMRPLDDIHLYRLMVITENNYGPINLNAHQSLQHLSYFVNRNWQFGNNGQGAATMLWTNWGGLDGTSYWLNGFGINPSNSSLTPTGWRQQLDSMEIRWHQMQDYANQQKPTNCPHVCIIPGNRMMAKFYDDVQANLVPGVTNVSQIFTDGVHLNNRGSYLVTMIHYACVFNANPTGLSNQLITNATVTPQFASYAQNMVWNLVTTYGRGCLTHLTDLKVNSLKNEDLRIFPNPASNEIFILNPIGISETNPVIITDMAGKEIMRSSSHPLNISGLDKGVYFLQLGSLKQKFVKE